MLILCPYCRKKVSPEETDHCPHCGCEVAMLGRLIHASRDSIKLALEALRDGHDREAHDFAYEAWGLKHSREAAAVGLLAAVSIRDPIEIPRWIRRRRACEV
ncbi:MAG: hypothetical protein JWM59_91 [Verrucomicrobiales bacterium]|nr:hypothetical protein [Verrucomicrobiales bacterium]